MGVKNRGKIGELGYQIFTQNKLDLTFRALNHWAKFHDNWIEIAAVGATTDTLTDASDFTTYPMLCCSSGTDEY